MTQEFEFETDNIGSLMKMLNTIGSILFDDTKITISKKAEDFNFCFDDGKYDNYDGYVVFGKDVIKSEKIVSGVKVCKGVDCFYKQKDAIEKAANLNRGLDDTPTRKFLMCIATNYSDYKGGKNYANFKNGKKYIDNTVLDLLNDEKLRSEFWKECGKGYNVGFDSQDGSIDVGYRLNWSPSGAEDRLHLSLVHMYYGK
jgi:hypothetical protein